MRQLHIYLNCSKHQNRTILGSDQANSGKDTEIKKKSQVKFCFKIENNMELSHMYLLRCKRFYKILYLKEHVSSIHEGITHECPICQKSFPYKNTMQAHVRELHEGKIKSVKCSMCDKEFKSNNHVKRHVMEVHEKKRPHACSLCDLRFGQKSQLKTHIKGKHKNVLL